MPEYQGTAHQITADPALASYMDTACWSSPHTNEEGTDHQEIYAHRLTKAARATMAADLADFLEANAEDIEAAGITTAQAAGDFWLSRNGHGAGFFDRGLGAPGDRLQAAAKVYGSADLYRHRGWIYHS